MKKRTKIIILSVMVLLLGVTGYLNVVLNNSINNDTTNTGTTTMSYFAAYREDREAGRQRELAYYQAIVDAEGETSEEGSAAKKCMMDLVAQIEKEIVVEGMIKGLGFEDCIMTVTPTNVNVVVKSTGLVEDEVAQIVAIIQDEKMGVFENIKVMSAA